MNVFRMTDARRFWCRSIDPRAATPETIEIGGCAGRRSTAMSLLPSATDSAYAERENRELTLLRLTLGVLDPDRAGSKRCSAKSCNRISGIINADAVGRAEI